MEGVTLSAAVMAHRRRERFVATLMGTLGTAVPVVWDRRSDRWDTGSRAMLAYPDDASHHLIIQDDAVLPRNFLAGVRSCLEAAPAEAAQSPLCLYVGKSGRYRSLVRQIPQDGVSWLTMPTLNWGVAVVFPVGMIQDAVQWGNARPDVPNWDKRLSRWLGHERISTWYTWPSLVDHRESPSLVPGRGHRGRTAQQFIGSHADALAVDWSGAVVGVEPWGTGRVRIRDDRSRVNGRVVRKRYGTPRKTRSGEPDSGGPRG